MGSLELANEHAVTLVEFRFALILALRTADREEFSHPRVARTAFAPPSHVSHVQTPHHSKPPQLKILS